MSGISHSSQAIDIKALAMHCEASVCQSFLKKRADEGEVVSSKLLSIRVIEAPLKIDLFSNWVIVLSSADTPFVAC